jgi:hypothetical protein
MAQETISGKGQIYCGDVLIGECNNFTISYTYDYELYKYFIYRGGRGIGKSWLYYNYLKLLQQIKEEQPAMQLGDTVLVQNELDIIEVGQATILAPGYAKDDVVIQQNEEESTVSVFFKNKDKEWPEYTFELDPDYKLKDLSYGIRDGVFRIKAEYDLKSNVRFDEKL